MLRHGIVHGRELAYGTRANSTKAFAALLALIVWAQPIARDRKERLWREREELHTGSRGRDDKGKWLDQRGFEDAKTGLWYVRGVQSGFFKREGRYATSRQELDPTGLVLDDVSDVELRTSAAGDEFWAWIVTPSGYVLGLASKDGEWASWYYAAEQSPAGGIDSAAEWCHEAYDDWPPDWA